MIDFSLLHFIRPAWLILLPVVGWLWWCRRNSKDQIRGWRGVIQPELLGAMTVGADNQSRSQWRDVSLLIAWLLAVIAVAGPTWRPEPSPFVDDPVPVMIVLKAGESMNLSDLMPSRMERARLKVADFASQRASQPLGLMAYAGSAHLVLPPTRDTAVVATMAAEVGPEIMPKPGDDLVAALALANKSLSESGGVIVVIADTAAVNPGSIADLGAKSQLPIYVLAIARTDTPELEALNGVADSLGATVTIMTPDSADIDRLVRQTSKAPVTTASTDVGTRWEEAGWWLVPALAVIVVGMFRRELRKTPQEQTA